VKTMCRLAYIPFSPTKLDTGLVGTLFQFLEMSFGGHGNGIGYFKENESDGLVPWHYKGATLSTDVITDFMVEEAVSGIFHTRLASMGSVCNDNCHPFSYNGVLTAHNGHWSDAHAMASMLIHANKFSASTMKDTTDSEVIACLVGNYGFGATDIVDGGTILSLYQDHAKVFVKSDFEVIMTPEGKYLYASEFPHKIIDHWKIKKYFRFSRGSIAKLTADGPKLVKGSLTKTAPSAWPSFKRGGGGRYDMYDYYESDFLLDRKISVSTTDKTLSFLPKRKGKKARRKPYRTYEVMSEVQKYLGYTQTPDIDALLESDEYIEMEVHLQELHDEIGHILWLPSARQDRKWLAKEVNSVVMAWLRINQTMINDYVMTKKRLEEVYGLSNYHGDEFLDGYDNKWVNFQGRWRMSAELSDDELEILSMESSAKWHALEE